MPFIRQTVSNRNAVPHRPLDGLATNQITPARFGAEIIRPLREILCVIVQSPGPVSLENQSHPRLVLRCSGGGVGCAARVRSLALLSMVLFTAGAGVWGAGEFASEGSAVGRCLDTWQRQIIVGSLVSVAASASSFVCSAALGTDEVLGTAIFARHASNTRHPCEQQE